MGDAKKRNTEMEKKVEKKESGSAGFLELRDDLFREAAKLVSEAPSTRIAIFVTPPASESDASIHSFGYPSAEGVVQTFLEDKHTVDDEEDEEEEEEEDPSSQRFWWEDEKQFDSMNPEELKAALDKLTREKNLLLEAKKRAQGSGNLDDQAGPKP